MIDQANIKLVLTDISVPDGASEIRESLELDNAKAEPLQYLPVQRADPNMYPDMEIDEDLKIPAKETALILFTSGSTGRPKAAALPRSRLFFKKHMDPEDLYLVYRPLHWVGTVLPPLSHVLRGGRVRSLKSGSYAGEVWEVLKEGNVTTIAIPPVFSKMMQEHYDASIRHLPAEEHDQYIRGASKLRSVVASASVMDPGTVEFWKNLTNMPLIARYAMTETGAPVLATSPDDPWVDVCHFYLY